MEWFEEPNLAKTLYEIIQIQTDLETIKRNLSLRCDFNFEDVSRIFDIQHRGLVSRL